MKKLLFWLGKRHCKNGIKQRFKFDRYLEGYRYQFFVEKADSGEHQI